MSTTLRALLDKKKKKAKRQKTRHTKSPTSPRINGLVLNQINGLIRSSDKDAAQAIDAQLVALRKSVQQRMIDLEVEAQGTGVRLVSSNETFGSESGNTMGARQGDTREVDATFTCGSKQQYFSIHFDVEQFEADYEYGGGHWMNVTMRGTYCIGNWEKVLFDYATDGQCKNAGLVDGCYSGIPLGCFKFHNVNDKIIEEFLRSAGLQSQVSKDIDNRPANHNCRRRYVCCDIIRDAIKLVEDKHGKVSHGNKGECRENLCLGIDPDLVEWYLMDAPSTNNPYPEGSGENAYANYPQLNCEQTSSGKMKE